MCEITPTGATKGIPKKRFSMDDEISKNQESKPNKF